MEPKGILKEIDKLNISEKIILVEDIWDNIAKENKEMPLPEWQKSELEKRYADYKAGKIKLHNWSEVHESLRDNFK